MMIVLVTGFICVQCCGHDLGCSDVNLLTSSRLACRYYSTYDVRCFSLSLWGVLKRVELIRGSKWGSTGRRTAGPQLSSTGVRLPTRMGGRKGKRIFMDEMLARKGHLELKIGISLSSYLRIVYGSRALIVCSDCVYRLNHYYFLV